MDTRIRDLRIDADLTQKDIATVLKTTFQYYNKYETGVRPMPMDRYVTLAKFYNVSLDYLCGLTATPKKLYPNKPSKVVGL